MGRGEREWQDAVRSAVPHPPTTIRLQFTVASLLRLGNRFDIDNMSKPVLDALGGEFESVWATVDVGNNPGVLVSAEPPPRSDMGRWVSISDPPNRSIRRYDVLPELADVEPVGANSSLGCHLLFGDPDTPIGDFGFEGPIKPLIDVLWPLLGGEANNPADHRIHDLRVDRSTGVEGVDVTIWELQRLAE